MADLHRQILDHIQGCIIYLFIQIPFAVTEVEATLPEVHTSKS